MGPLTVGVEEEFHVVDLATGDLVPRAGELLGAAAGTLGDLVTRELHRCQVETTSPVCERVDDVVAHLARARTVLAAHARPLGLGVAALATHPTGRWAEQGVDRSEARYRRLERDFQQLAREQIICGFHVHVGVDDPELRVRLLRRLGPWLPALLALSANSPFWEGDDTGYESYRHELWGRWPTAGMPPDVESVEAYDDVVDHLLATGVARDRGNLYWYARPSQRYPTVELRVCDAVLRIDDAAALAVLSRALVWTEAEEERRRGGAPRPAVPDVVLEAAMWRASRYGLTGELVSPTRRAVMPAAEVVHELVDHVRGGLEVHGDVDVDVATTAVARIVRDGTGSTEQRRVVAAADARALVEQAVDRTASAA